MSGGRSSPLKESRAPLASTTKPVSPTMNGGTESAPSSSKPMPPAPSSTTAPAWNATANGSGSPSASSCGSHAPGPPLTGTSSGEATRSSAPRSTTRTANGPVQSTSTVSSEP